MKVFGDNQRIEKIWHQAQVPVIHRLGKGHSLRVRLPYLQDNRTWLQGDKRRSPVWNKIEKYWELPQAWLNDVVKKSLEKWGKVYIIQPFREHEICAPACRSAQGYECECSCMGENHGSNSDVGWHDVSDTFSIKWGEQHVACRMLIKKK